MNRSSSSNRTRTQGNRQTTSRQRARSNARGSSTRSTSQQHRRAASQRGKATNGSIRGKRSSVKAAAQKQVKRKSAINSRNLKRVKHPRQGLVWRIIGVIGIVAIITVLGGVAVVFQNDSSKYAATEQWRPFVTEACNDCGLDPQWTDCLLAAIVIESGGKEGVNSVMGVEGDIMQAAEGAYGWIVTEGWPEHAVAAQTPEASIYAGVMEFKQNLELWKSYLGEFTPEDTTEIQLVIQGYNFGADGWFAWCKNRGIRAYTVDLAREYSDTVMPEGAKGTPTHAQKWLNAYKNVHKEQQ